MSKKYRLYQRIVTVLENQEHQILTRKQIIEKIRKRYKIKPSSVNLTSFCYNRYNKGVRLECNLFHYACTGKYEYLGTDYNYTGLVYQRKKGAKEDVVVGDWLSGSEVLYYTGWYLFIEDRRKRRIESLKSIYYNSSFPKQSIKAKPI